jgi:asparagine synthase (glutamine-hydrolysing)
MVADVPVGAFLSGGMDSSAVVALMARAGAGRVRTFSIGFDEAGFDELAHARRVARRYDTDHYEFVVKPDALEALPRLAWQLDEPFADASALPTYYVSKITREHVTVALSGDGGDESFAGYRRYTRGQALHERMDRLPGSLIRPLVGLAARLMPAGARGQGYLGLLGTPAVDRYFKLVTAHDAASLGRLLTAEVRGEVRATADPGPFRRLVAEAGPPDYVSAMQYVDIRTYLPDDILAKVDRTSMLVSLETRVPLLDHRLMEYVARIPSRLKLSAGRGKVIFKKAMAPDLPPQILQRGKMGFGVPLGVWFRRDLADYVRDTLQGPRARARGIFEPRAVAHLLAEHAAGPRDRSARIWALLMFEEWARRWLDG